MLRLGKVIGRTPLRIMQPTAWRLRSFHRHPAVKSLALFVSAVFFGQSLFPPEVLASVQQRVASRSEANPSATSIDPCDPARVTLPERLGRVTETFRPESGATRLVIHLQDVHAHQQTQRDLASIIGHLRRSLRVSMVALEGGAGPGDTSFFSDFPDATANDAVAQFFLKQGLFTGPVYYAVTHPGEVNLYGVEDPVTYLDHLKLYEATYPKQVEAYGWIAQVSSVLHDLQDQLDTPALKELDAKSRAFTEERLDFTDYARYVTNFAGQQHLELADSPNLSRLLQVGQLDATINLASVEREHKKLVQTLSQRLAKADLEALLKQQVALRAGRLSERQYYEGLQQLAKDAGLVVAADAGNPYANLVAYAASLRLSETLDLNQLSAELDRVVAAVKERLFATPEQRQLDELTIALDVVGDLYRAKLDQARLDYYHAHQAAFTAPSFVTFLDAHRRLTPALAQAIHGLFDDLSEQEAFYTLAQRRDEALIDNTLKAMDEQGQSVAVLVTGGFHTQGMTRLLKERGVAYAVVTPGVEGSTNEDLYNKLVRNRVPSIERLIHDFAGDFQDSNRGRGWASLLVPDQGIFPSSDQVQVHVGEGPVGRTEGQQSGGPTKRGYLRETYTCLVTVALSLSGWTAAKIQEAYAKHPTLGTLGVAVKSRGRQVQLAVNGTTVTYEAQGSSARVVAVESEPSRAEVQLASAELGSTRVLPVGVGLVGPAAIEAPASAPAGAETEALVAQEPVIADRSARTEDAQAVRASVRPETVELQPREAAQDTASRAPIPSSPKARRGFDPLWLLDGLQTALGVGLIGVGAWTIVVAGSVYLGGALVLIGGVVVLRDAISRALATMRPAQSLALLTGLLAAVAHQGNAQVGRVTAPAVLPALVAPAQVPLAKPTAPNAAQVSKWLDGQQLPNEPLFRSFDIRTPDPRVAAIDPRANEDLKTFANTYDQALVALFDLYDGNQDYSRAKAILKYFQDQGGVPQKSSRETEIITGEAVWVGIAAVHYTARTGDKQFLLLIQRIAEYLKTMQQADGRIKGGPGVPWTASEHNIDVVAFLEMAADKRVLNSEKYRPVQRDVAKWLVSHAYLAGQAAMRRGHQDNTFATDVYFWMISMTRAMRHANPGLSKEAGLDTVDLPGLMRTAEGRSRVVGYVYTRPDKTTRTVTVFRYTDRASSPPSGEWTAEGALAYSDLGEASNTVSILSSLDSVADVTDGRRSLPYALEPGKTFPDGWLATSYGSIASTVWDYMARSNRNLFTLDPLPAANAAPAAPGKVEPAPEEKKPEQPKASETPAAEGQAIPWTNGQATGTNWASTWTDVKPARNLKGQDELVLELRSPKPGTKIAVQLLNAGSDANQAVGLHEQTVTLAEGANTVHLPLKGFQDVDLTKVVRIVIHHGMEAYGTSLNPTNTGRVGVISVHAGAASKKTEKSEAAPASPTMPADAERWAGARYSGAGRASQRHDFSAARDLSKKQSLRLAIKGGRKDGKIIVQLVDKNTQPDSDVGASTPITLKGGDEVLEIPVDQFAGADLTKIQAVVIHHGKLAWGQELNDSTVPVTVDRFTFTAKGSGRLQSHLWPSLLFGAWIVGGPTWALWGGAVLALLSGIGFAASVVRARRSDARERRVAYAWAALFTVMTAVIGGFTGAAWLQGREATAPAPIVQPGPPGVPQGDLAPYRRWIESQRLPGTPLVRSFQLLPDETNAYLEDFANTYDQALVAIDALNEGDATRAAEILQYYQDLGTVPPKSNKEGQTIVGEAVWIGMATAHYTARTGKQDFLPLLRRIADYVLEQQQSDGRIKGGDVPWTSTEHNLDVLAFLDMAHRLLGDAKYAQAQAKVAGWLLTEAYIVDHELLSGGRRLARGANDPVHATDVNAWAVAVLTALKQRDPARFAALGLDAILLDGVIQDVERTARAQRQPYRKPDGTVVTVTLFRYQGNNPSSPRSFEWTGEMVLAYRLRGQTDKATAVLRDLTVSTISLPNGLKALAYAAEAGRTFPDGWDAGPNPAISSTVWYRWAMRGFNPFQLDHASVPVTAVPSQPAESTTPASKPAPGQPAVEQPAVPTATAQVGQRIGWTGDYSSGPNWSATWTQPPAPINATGATMLVIRVRSVNHWARIRVQLLNSEKDAETNKGLSDRTVTIDGGAQTVQLPLSSFGDVDLGRIVRITIHHGQEAFGKHLNPTNDASVDVTDVAFTKTAAKPRPAPTRRAAPKRSAKPPAPAKTASAATFETWRGQSFNKARIFVVGLFISAALLFGGGMEYLYQTVGPGAPRIVQYLPLEIGHDTGPKWAVTWVDLKPAYNATNKRELELKVVATPNTKIRIQLVPEGSDPNQEGGLNLRDITLKGGEETFRVTLGFFNGLDLSRLSRVSVHYGQETFGMPLNPANDGSVRILSIGFTEEPDPGHANEDSDHRVWRRMVEREQRWKREQEVADRARLNTPAARADEEQRRRQRERDQQFDDSLHGAQRATGSDSQITLVKDAGSKPAASASKPLGWTGDHAKGPDWASTWTQLRTPVNAKGYTELVLDVSRATPKTKIRIQLLSDASQAGQPVGLHTRTFTLTGKPQKLHVSLSGFADADLSKVVRIVVHHGKRAFDPNTTLNPTNNATVSIRQATLTRGGASTENPQGSPSIEIVTAASAQAPESPARDEGPESPAELPEPAATPPITAASTAPPAPTPLDAADAIVAALTEGQPFAAVVQPYLAGVPGVTPEQIAQAIEEVSAVYAQAREAATTPATRAVVDRAFALSLVLHADQPRARGDTRPYIIHVAGVVRLLLDDFQLQEQVTDPVEVGNALAAAWLHDTIEDGKKGRWGKARLAELENDTGALRDETGQQIQAATNPEVLQLVQGLSKPEYEGDNLDEEIRIEAQYYLDLAQKRLGTQLIKAADFAFNLGDLKNHPDRTFPRKFFIKRLGPVLGFLPGAHISAGAKAALVRSIRASVEENNQLNLTQGDPEKAPSALTPEQEQQLAQVETTLGRQVAHREDSETRSISDHQARANNWQENTWIRKLFSERYFLKRRARSYLIGYLEGREPLSQAAVQVWVDDDSSEDGTGVFPRDRQAGIHAAQRVLVAAWLSAKHSLGHIKMRPSADTWKPHDGSLAVVDYLEGRATRDQAVEIIHTDRPDLTPEQAADILAEAEALVPRLNPTQEPGPNGPPTIGASPPSKPQELPPDAAPTSDDQMLFLHPDETAGEFTVHAPAERGGGSAAAPGEGEELFAGQSNSSGQTSDPRKARRALGEFIRSRRVTAGFHSQAALAEAVGTTPSSVTKFEQGEARPGYELALGLSSALKVRFKEFWPLVGEAREEARRERLLHRRQARGDITPVRDAQPIQDLDPALANLQMRLMGEPIAKRPASLPGEQQSPGSPERSTVTTAAREELGQFIRENRQKAGFRSQRALADKLGVTPSAVTKWEQGQVPPSLSISIALAKEIDVDIQELQRLSDAARTEAQQARRASRFTALQSPTQGGPAERAPSPVPEEREELFAGQSSSAGASDEGNQMLFIHAVEDNGEAAVQAPDRTQGSESQLPAPAQHGEALTTQQSSQVAGDDAEAAALATTEQLVRDVQAADPILAQYDTVARQVLDQYGVEGRRPLIYLVGSEAVKTATGLATLMKLREEIIASDTTHLVNLVYVHTDPAVSQADLFDTFQIPADTLFDLTVNAQPTAIVRQQIIDGVNQNRLAYAERTGRAVAEVTDLTRDNTVTFASNAQAPVPVEERTREVQIFQDLVRDAVHVLVEQPETKDQPAVADYSQAVLSSLVAVSQAPDVSPELQADIAAVTDEIRAGHDVTIAPRPSSALHAIDQRHRSRQVTRSHA